MSMARLPILIWRGTDGLHTAAVVELPEIAAVGSSAQECLAQLKHYLAWLQRNEPWNFPAGDVLEPQLATVRVEVRPEYVIGSQRHPSAPVTVTAPAVHGRYATGLLLCSIPPLKLWFSYHEANKLKELAGHYVREAMQGKTPQQIAPFMGAGEFSLDEILIPVEREREQRHTPRYQSLEAVAEPLGERGLRKQFSRAWEREREISNLVGRLSRDLADVVLVGAPGVGKTSVLASAVREIERTIEGTQEKRRFWLTSASRLIAGMPYLGQWEQRLENVIAEISSFRGVLCIENLLDPVRLGGHDATDSVGAFILPYMLNRELQVVTEATPEEFDACRRLLPGLADAFQVQTVDSFEPATAARVLDRFAQAGARNLRVETGNDTVQLAYRLFRRFRPYDAFPGKAAAFLSTLIQQAAETPSRTLESSRVLERFIEDTGLPQNLLRDDVLLHEPEVLATLSARVIGQDAACRIASGVITTFKAGLNDPARPLGVLLFSGPTGVGKTELARAISDYLFGHGGSKERLVRLDMSEYTGHGAAERLVSTPGGDASEFLKRVRGQPFCVVLLDEIEKASPDVFDMLLALFDEGRLTDRFGRVTTFQSSVIILTSNLGQSAGGAIGFGQTQGPDYEAEVMRFFRPEFYNRLDAVVAFNPLEQTTILRIATKELGELAQREGLSRAALRLEWDEAVLELVARAGFDRRFGARPLQRALEELVVTPLARHLAQHPQTHGKLARLSVVSGRIAIEWA